MLCADTPSGRSPVSIVMTPAKGEPSLIVTPTTETTAPAMPLGAPTVTEAT